MSKYSNILVLDGVKYSPFEYEEEKTLEKDVIRNIKYIFGENAWFIPKLKIKPSEGSGTIPDLYVLDIHAKKLYIIEVERISHSIPDHITTQIAGFYRILSDKSSTADFLNKLYDKVIKNCELKSALKYGGIEEIHKFLADILVQNYEVVLIIDDITSELKNAFSYTNPIPKILEFKRFKRSDADVFIYKMDTLEREITNADSTSTNNVNVNSVTLNGNTVKDLISIGMPIYMKYKGNIYTAIREADGIKLEDGSIEPTLLLATKKITGWKSVNIWKHWFLDRECTKSINLLRVRK